MQQFLAWVDEAPRSYADAEAWRRSCPHLSIWEDAIAEASSASRTAAPAMRRLMLTQLGRKRLFLTST